MSSSSGATTTSMDSGFRSHLVLRTDAAPVSGTSAIGMIMSLELFHTVLGAFFVGVWVIVGQIVATDRSHLSQ